MSVLYFAVYLILFEDYICPFPKKLAQFHANLNDKVGKKTANEEERERKKRERERKIEIDSQKKSKFWLVRMRENKKLFNYAQ